MGKNENSSFKEFLDGFIEFGESILNNVDDAGNLIEYYVDEFAGSLSDSLNVYKLSFEESEDLAENLKQLTANAHKCYDFVEKLYKTATRVKETVGTEQEDTALGLFGVYFEIAESGFAWEIDEFLKLMINLFDMEDEYNTTLCDAVDSLNEATEDCPANNTTMVKTAYGIFTLSLSIIKLTAREIKNHLDKITEGM